MNKNHKIFFYMPPPRDTPWVTQNELGYIKAMLKIRRFFGGGGHTRNIIKR
jgi:hypothetical protein